MASPKLPTRQFVNSVVKSFMAHSGLEPRLFGPHFRVTDAVPGTVKFELDITKDHTNRLKAVHGGTIASMVDFGGSLAVASMGLHATGVTTDLNVTYLKKAGIAGDKILATAQCDTLCKTMAYTTVHFRNSSDELVARGSHTKYVRNAQRNHLAMPYTVPEGEEVADADEELGSAPEEERVE